MTMIRKTLAAAGVVATFAVTALAALPASAQNWHHRPRYKTIHHRVIVHHPILRHHPIVVRDHHVVVHHVVHHHH